MDIISIRRSTLLLTFFILAQVVTLYMAHPHNLDHKLENLAFCPFDVHMDVDDTRNPSTLKQVTCRTPSDLTRGGGGGGGSGGKAMSRCAEAGGHCVQMRFEMDVVYEDANKKCGQALKDRVRVNTSCVCTQLPSRPAIGISPMLT